MCKLILCEKVTFFLLNFVGLYIQGVRVTVSPSPISQHSHSGFYGESCGSYRQAFCYKSRQKSITEHWFAVGVPSGVCYREHESSEWRLGYQGHSLAA